MKLNSYHREIVRFLEDEYSVKDANIAPSGSRNTHPVLRFTYQGCPRKMQVHSSGGIHNRDPMNLLALKKQDLRRMLGPKPQPPDITISYTGITATKPEEITMEMQAKPFNPLPIQQAVHISKTYPVSSSVYPSPGATTGKLRVRFYLPEELAHDFGKGSCRIERMDDEHWKVVKDPLSALTIKKYKGQKWWTLEISSMEGEERIYYQSPGEATIVDGSILFYSPLSTRKWIVEPKHTNIVEVLQKAAKLQHSDVETTPSQRDILAALASNVQFAGIERAAHACLDELRRIERETPYRLVKVRDKATDLERWVFSAPRIE